MHVCECVEAKVCPGNGSLHTVLENTVLENVDEAKLENFLSSNQNGCSQP